MRKMLTWWIVPLICGLCCSLLIASYFWTSRSEANNPYAKVARSLHMDEQTLHKELDLVAKAATKHVLSQSDWSYLEHCFYSHNPDEQLYVISAISSASIPKERVKQVHRMVIQYVGQNPGVVDPEAVYLLYRLHDPLWKSEALKLLNYPNPMVVDVSRGFFKRVGLLDQLEGQ